MSRLMPHTLKALESELVYQEQEQDEITEGAAGYYQLFAELDHLSSMMMVARSKDDPGRARDLLREMTARCIRLMTVEPVEPRTVYINELNRSVPVDELQTATYFDNLHPKGLLYRLEEGQYVLDIPETDPPDTPQEVRRAALRKLHDADIEDPPHRPRSNTDEAADREGNWEQIPYVYQDWLELDTAWDRIARQLPMLGELDTLRSPHAGDLFFIKDIGEYCILMAVIPEGHGSPPRGTYMLRGARVNRGDGILYADTARLGGYNEDGDVVSYLSAPYDQGIWQEHDRRGIARLRDDQEWETDILSLPDPQPSDLFYINRKQSYCIILRAPVVDGAHGEYMLRHAVNRTALDERAPYRVGDSHGRPTRSQGEVFNPKPLYWRQREYSDVRWNLRAGPSWNVPVATLQGLLEAVVCGPTPTAGGTFAVVDINRRVYIESLPKGRKVLGCYLLGQGREHLARYTLPPTPPPNEQVSGDGEVRDKPPEPVMPENTTVREGDVTKELPPGAVDFTVRHKPGVPDGFDVVTDRKPRT